MDIKEEDILGEAVSTHWYYVAKGLAMRRLLGPAPVQNVLDVGAGSGVFARQLLDCGLAESATCLDPGYREERSEVYAGKPLRFVREADAVSQDLILMMDVLEHVDDDRALLRQYTDAMADSARVFITVPAFQSLWSGHDVFLGHRKRYTLGEVTAMVESAGLRVLKARYFFGSILPIVAAARLWHRLKASEPRSSLRPAPKWLNHALVAAHHVEAAVLLPWNRFAGLSVMCLAGRP